MPLLPNLDDGVTAELDIRTGRWRLSLGDQQIELREWTWGERRRLVWSATVQGSFDRGLFFDTFFELLTEPPPNGAWRTRAACRCLQLLGVPDDVPANSARPFCQSELMLLQHFRWLPADLDCQQVCVVDKLVDQLAPTALSAGRARGSPAWTRILVVDQPAHITPAATEERLDRMLAFVAGWAGLASETPPEPVRTENEPGQGASHSAATTEHERLPAWPDEPADGAAARIGPLAPAPAGAPVSERSGTQRFPGVARLQTRQPSTGGERPPNPAGPARDSRNAFTTAPARLSSAAQREITTPPSSSRGRALIAHPAEMTQTRTDSRGPAVALSNLPLGYGGKTQGAPGLPDSPNAVTSRAETRRLVECPPARASLPVLVSQSQFASLPPGNVEPAFALGDAELVPSSSAHPGTWRLENEISRPDDMGAGPTASSRPAENPFALSELETRLADVLERAAREHGVELP